MSDLPQPPLARQWAVRLLSRAGIAVLVLLLTTLLGGADCMEVFTGTRPMGGLAKVLGIVHALAHVFVWLVGPPMAIAGLLCLLRGRLGGRPETA